MIGAGYIPDLTKESSEKKLEGLGSGHKLKLLDRSPLSFKSTGDGQLKRKLGEGQHQLFCIKSR